MSADESRTIIGVPHNAGVDSTSNGPTHQGLGWRLVWGSFALSWGLVAVGWVLFSLVLAVFTCDENCSGNEADDFRYTGQFLLACAGGLLTIAGLALGFTRRLNLAMVLIVTGATCGLCWWLWVLVFGTF